MSINTPFNFDTPTFTAHTCLYTPIVRDDGSIVSAGSSCEFNAEEISNDKTLSQLLDTYKKFSTGDSAAKNLASEDLVKAYKQVIQKTTRFDDTTADSPYRNNYNKLMNELDATRTELDSKLESIYNTKGSLGYEYKSHYESTIMSGVLWGTLAVTMIYYVFYKSDQ